MRERVSPGWAAAAMEGLREDVRAVPVRERLKLVELVMRDLIEAPDLAGREH